MTLVSFFWYRTLLTFLLDQHSTGPYKGIVFLRTRQAVYYIADLIRRTKQLEFLQVWVRVELTNGAEACILQGLDIICDYICTSAAPVQTDIDSGREWPRATRD